MSASSVSTPKWKIAITGSDGLFGWHLRCFLKTKSYIEIFPISRKSFQNPALLREQLESADALIHLAGMNRGDDQEILSTNISLTQRLIETLTEIKRTPHVLFANSTHVSRDTPYGKSKKESASLLTEWAKANNALFSDVIFPHLFGEHGKPFYNSVVSTFCYQMAKGEKPSFHQDSEIEPLHLSEASEFLWNLIKNGHEGQIRATGKPIMVSELLALISKMDGLYKKRLLPDLASPFEEQLFNTYRSYLFPEGQPLHLELKSDARGSLFEAIKTNDHGQGFLSTTHPGFTRGNHFHIKKFERFCVVKGQATIRIRKLFSDEITSFQVSGDAPCAVDIPTLHTHNITNTGSEELITLFWSGEIFDPSHPDTYGELVESPPQRPPSQVEL
ncbi:MAG: NAD-dependent epimerase/dehydratase family protein [Bdellovibrionales bacterium]